MAQGLHLAQKQMLSQVLAPQLQQSLALLQAPTLELKALVEQEIQQNPVLEEIPTEEMEQKEKTLEDGPAVNDASDPAEPPSDLNYDPATEKPSRDSVDDFQVEFEKLTKMDQEWKDHFAQTNLPMRSSAEAEERRQFMFDSLVAPPSLTETLLEQVRLSDVPKEQWQVAEMIIGNIDDYGYLKASVDELSFSTGISAEKISQVLQVIQSFHPPGVGARSLQECLMIQLERAGRKTSYEYRIVRDFMDALGKRRVPEIARGLGINNDQAQEAISRIGHLDPRPGRVFLPDDDRYIVAEVFVQKVGDEYTVTLNNEHVPHLRISNTYKDLMSQNDSTSEVKDYIRDKIKAGKFLIKSLHQRQQTIINIATEIVKRQRDFMENGVSGLKPMTMVQVAEAVGVHETTVSRAVSNKYMQTPKGIFEMKYFFTSGIQQAGGADVSNASVKEMIAEMFKNEDPGKPLSDQEIVKMLQEKGLVIARRTVAKYRTELNILPSNLRKTY